MTDQGKENQPQSYAERKDAGLIVEIDKKLRYYVEENHGSSTDYIISHFDIYRDKETGEYYVRSDFTSEYYEEVTVFDDEQSKYMKKGEKYTDLLHNLCSYKPVAELNDYYENNEVHFLFD